MESGVRILGEKKLENGLTVTFYDQSKPIAGGRWRVELKAWILLQVKPEHFASCTTPLQAYTEFTSAVGESISFEQLKARNFIDDGAKEELLETMMQEFLQSNALYLGNRDFELKVVLKTYREWLQDKAWKDARHQVIGEGEAQKKSSE
jgi:hypothetical protein